ncbi:MAG TPA: CDP-glucose 4,6-dehydratase [Acidobacteriaceae bacterium]|nr:CDP-glucose 4,6-dehydratase [Acidobacteriaceae bacterium]
MGQKLRSMEDLVNAFWQGRKVFLTGHTGFKGGWLSLWLQQLGAEVSGYAFAPHTTPNLFGAARVAEGMTSTIADLNNLQHLKDAMASHRTEIVLHLAAQSLVRVSYQDPIGTYETNVLGTARMLEAVRSCDSVRAVVVVTTDKCYENHEWVWPYREIDALGGHDPYSNSKACAELVTSAYRNSFFPVDRYAEHNVAIASARAGNVIGGGDWSSDRLIADIIRAFTAGETLRIRNPKATRPWQHVLEPLRGYLSLAENLYRHGAKFSGAWNFGPQYDDGRPVEWIVEHLASRWRPSGNSPPRWEIDRASHPHEAQMLKLDWTKASLNLGWNPVLSLPKALDMTLDWYQSVQAGEDARQKCLNQIEAYTVQSRAAGTIPPQ